jgi:hypothetical protein
MMMTEGATIEQRGDSISIDWGFWDKQLEALDELRSGDHDIVIFRGGYGSGKSILGARWLIETALAVPQSDNLILAPDSAKGGPTTYKVLFEQLPGDETVPDEGGEPENSPVVDDYNRNDNRLTLVNGSVIRLGSADKWNRYAGAEFNAIWCDEVGHYTNTDLYKLNRMLISRQRTADGPNVTLWTSTGNGYNDFYHFSERQVTPDGEPIPTRIENVIADSRDNPFLKEKDKLRRQFEGTSAEAQGLAGGFASAEGRVYSTFNRSEHVVPADLARTKAENGWRIYGYDAGWNDPRVLLEIGRTSLGQFVVLGCFYRSEAHVGDPDGPGQGTALRWLDTRPMGTIYAEHAPSDIDKFRAAGWGVQKADKDIDGGIETVRERLDDDEGRPGLLVSEECDDLIQEFLSYQEDDVGSKSADDHALDALRYAIFTHEAQSYSSGWHTGERMSSDNGKASGDSIEEEVNQWM